MPSSSHSLSHQFDSHVRLCMALEIPVSAIPIPKLYTDGKGNKPGCTGHTCSGYGESESGKGVLSWEWVGMGIISREEERLGILRVNGELLYSVGVDEHGNV